MATNQMNSGTENKQMDQTQQRLMMWMMPLMSLWIRASPSPPALSVYWISQYSCR